MRGLNGPDQCNLEQSVIMTDLNGPDQWNLEQCHNEGKAYEPCVHVDLVSHPGERSQMRFFICQVKVVKKSGYQSM